MGSLSFLMQCHGFDPPLRRIFPVEGFFPLELTWVLTPFPQNSFGWEYKLRTSLFTHAFHCMHSKDPDVHVLDAWVNAGNKNTPSMPSMKTEYDYLNGWIKKMVTYATISPKMVNPRDIGGDCRRRRRSISTKSVPVCTMFPPEPKRQYTHNSSNTTPRTSCTKDVEKLAQPCQMCGIVGLCECACMCARTCLPVCVHL